MPNFDESVHLPGVGTFSLRTALRRIVALPPPPPGSFRQTSLFRMAECNPSIYDFADIERFAHQLETLESGDAKRHTTNVPNAGTRQSK